MIFNNFLKNTMVWLSTILLLIISSQARAYNYPEGMVKQMKSEELVLQRMEDGYHWVLSIAPGKLQPKQTALFRLQIMKMGAQQHTKLAAGAVRPQGRFLKAFGYLDKKPVKLDNSWQSPQQVPESDYFQWQAGFPAAGDYMLDITLQRPSPEGALPSDLVTFYFTVSRQLAPGEQPKYLGDKVCRQCHQVQFISWQKSKKASTFEVLKPGVRRAAKQKAGLDAERDYTHDPKCLPCHTTGYGLPGGFVSIEKTPDLANIQCEGCHGAGEEFLWLMRRKYSFAHSEVDDLGHLRFASHRQTPQGHVHSLDPDSVAFCIKACHNEKSPTYRPLAGTFEEQVKKSVHRLYKLKFKHWDFDHQMDMSMPGLPDRLFSLMRWVLLGLSALLLLLFLREPAQGYRRWSLFNISPLKRWMHSRLFQLSLQLPMVFFFFLIVASGFWGSQLPHNNLATILAWNIWWTLIVFDVALFGRWWCSFCPWDALASWLQRLSFWRRRPKLLSLKRQWPAKLQNIHLATGLFIVFTWLQTNYAVNLNPQATAYLALLILGLAVGAALLFEKKPFCQYGCFVGRVCGLYSLLSPIELRKKNPRVCARCKGKDCYRGNERGYPCPTNQHMDEMSANTYCTLCGECLKSCPYNNISLNLRPPESGLVHYAQTLAWDETLMILVLWGITFYHGLSMTPVWPQVLERLDKISGWGQMFNQNLGLLGIILLLLLALGITSALAALLSRNKPLGFVNSLNDFALPILAIALFYHLAHNLGHFVMEGSRIIPALSDPLGLGWNLFGSAGFTPGPLLSPEWIWGLQLGLIVMGHCYALRCAHRLALRLFSGRKPLLGIFPLWCLLSLLSMISLWLISLPMQGKCG